MTRPNPYKLLCPQCGYSKIATPKSDVLMSDEMFDKCPKCDANIEIKKLTVTEGVLSSIFQSIWKS